MKEALEECIALLERLRDTYLPNHQTERSVISAAVDRARAELEVERKPALELESKRKYAKKK